MYKDNKFGKVCSFCPYVLGCSEISIPDDVSTDDCHACVYNHPLDDKGYVVIEN